MPDPEQPAQDPDAEVGSPSPEGVTGDPGAAGPLEAAGERESGLAAPDSSAEAGRYGAVDAGELAEGVGAGTLSGNPDQGRVSDSPAPEREATADEGMQRGEL